MTTNPTPPAIRCHAHRSWLCGVGQGKCQHPARGEASTRLAEIRAAVTREATTLGPIADDMAWLLDRGDAAEKCAKELEQWRQDLYTALGVSRALTPQEVAAQVRKALVDLGAAEAERDGYAAAIRTAREALIHAERLCRYHADTPPAHPPWHGGCDSCKQPTRVRAALAAIDTAQRATLATQDGPHDD